MKTRSPLESSGALPPVTRSSWVSFRRVPSPPHAGDPPRTTIRERTMTPSVTFIKRGLPSLCRRVHRVLPGGGGITPPPPAAPPPSLTPPLTSNRSPFCHLHPP